MPLLSGPPAFVLVLMLGLILGSFASAMSWRIPRHESWVRARSACTSCGHLLGVADLVPFFSWLFLRGKCRHCRAPIGLRYPLIELTTLILCLLVHATAGLTLPGIIMMLAMPFLVALIVIDLDHMILPDQLNIILFGLGVAFVLANAPGTIVLAALAAAVYAGLLFVMGWVMSRLLKKDAVGFGDVKFMIAAGMWLGLPMLPAFLILSGLCGVAFGLIWKLAGRSAVFPFGPALILALLTCLLLRGEIAYAMLYGLGF